MKQSTLQPDESEIARTDPKELALESPCQEPILALLARQDIRTPCELALAATNGRVAERDVAATLLAAASQTIAPGLQHFAAPLVAAGAANAAAVLGQFTSYCATAKIDLATGNAIDRAAARTQLVARNLAQVLQGYTGNFVIAAAVDLESTGTLFKPQLAAWQHQEVVRGSGSWLGSELRGTISRLGGTLNENGVRHHKSLLLGNVNVQCLNRKLDPAWSTSSND